MLVSEIITRVRDAAGDKDVLQFTDATVLNWINDGVRECAIENALLQKRATQNTVANQTDYDLPVDILKLHSVKIDGQKIRVLTLEEFDKGGTNTTETGTPVLCYVWAGKLTLYPKPDRIIPIAIDYIYAPVPIVVGVPGPPIVYNPLTPALPEQYHLRLVHYCLAQVAEQDDDMPRYQMKMQEFSTGVQSLRDLPESEHDLYPSISVSVRDMGYGVEEW